MGRKPCCEKSSGLKRGPWTIEEDHKLINFILNNGIQCWRVVPKLAGLQRCGKSCRLRWINYLRPDLKRGALTEAEEDMIIQLHARLGNRWSKIAAHFPGRTDNEIKNHWNTRIKKKLKSLGVDPLTHQPLEQHENHCNSSHSDEKKSVATEVENKLDVLLLRDYQVGYDTKTMPMYNSGLASNNSNIQQQIGGGSGANMGLMMMSGHDQRDFSLNKFGLEFGVGGGGEDFVESWIDSPFQWDAFNTSEEDFL